MNTDTLIKQLVLHGVNVPSGIYKNVFLTQQEYVYYATLRQNYIGNSPTNTQYVFHKVLISDVITSVGIHTSLKKNVECNFTGTVGVLLKKYGEYIADTIHVLPQLGVNFVTLVKYVGLDSTPCHDEEQNLYYENTYYCTSSDIYSIISDVWTDYTNKRDRGELSY